MRTIEHTVASNGYVGNYQFSDSETPNAYSLVVYLRPGVCRSVENRKQALKNLASKVNDLNGVDAVETGLVGTGKQNKGYMCSLKVFTEA